MKLFEKLLEHADATLAEAEDYVEEAILIKSENQKLASQYVTLAEQHLNHYNDLHSQMVSLINEYKNTNGEAPAGMKVAYDILHKKEIERYTTVKRMIDHYRTL